MRKLKRLAVLAVVVAAMGGTAGALVGLLLVPQKARAEAAPTPSILLTDASARAGDDLSGLWHYSPDLYRTGVGNPRSQRYRDVDVGAAQKSEPHTLYEFNMDAAPEVTLPGAWNAAEPSLRYFDGLMWYQRHFTPQPLNNRRAFLRFEAINYKADVYLNGQLIGHHEGGFTPFSIEVTKALRAGDNQITLGVDSSHSADSVPPTITDWDIYGGVTRPIRLIYTPQTFIDDEFIHLDADHHIRAQVHLNGAGAGAQAVTLKIGERVNVKAVTDANGDAKFDLPLPKKLKLWSPDTPNLYTVSFSAGEDRLTDTVGFRTISVAGDQLLLNDKPIFLRGISMHEEEFGSNPARLMTPEAVKALFSQIKDGLHGNYVRLAHYPHNEITTRMADEMGLLVWSEIPVYWSVDFANDKTLATARGMIAENILRDRNRASVIVWSVGNETPITNARNAFLGQLADDAHALDPTRLVSAALLVDRKVVEGHIDLTVDDPLISHLDLVAVNTYNGWYGEDNLADVSKTRWHMPLVKPMIFSEFGADALAGFHDPTTTAKFSEEYQADFYRATLAMADQIPFLRGMSPWVLKDFQSPRRQHPVYQKGWNRKGLLSETGQRKLAFSVLADYYSGKAAPKR